MAEFEKKAFNTGDVIFREGEAGSEMYLVRSGSVKISRGDTELGQISKGEIFGEMALISDEPRMATAVAEDATVLEVVSKSDFMSRFNEVTPFNKALIKLLAMNIKSLSDFVSSK